MGWDGVRGLEVSSLKGLWSSRSYRIPLGSWCVSKSIRTFPRGTQSSPEPRLPGSGGKRGVSTPEILLPYIRFQGYLHTLVTKTPPHKRGTLTKPDLPRTPEVRRQVPLLSPSVVPTSERTFEGDPSSEGSTGRREGRKRAVNVEFLCSESMVLNHDLVRQRCLVVINPLLFNNGSLSPRTLDFE